MLIAAAESGLILIMTVDLHGRWVRSGKKDFIDTGDPSVAARYVEALYVLVSRGLVLEEIDAFRLSGTGFDVARRLQKE